MKHKMFVAPLMPALLFMITRLQTFQCELSNMICYKGRLSTVNGYVLSTHNVNNTVQLSPELCILSCSWIGKSYAGTSEDPESCYCADSLDTTRILNSHLCNSSRGMGGPDGLASVYDVPPSPYFIGMKLNAKSVGVVKEEHQFQITLKNPPRSNDSPNCSCNYGDGLYAPWSRCDSTFKTKFRLPGIYRVKCILDIDKNMTEIGAVTYVNISEPVREPSLDFGETNEEGYILVQSNKDVDFRVYVDSGSDVQVALDFGDGSSKQNTYAPDPIRFAIGPEIPLLASDDIVSSEQTGLHIDPSSTMRGSINMHSHSGLKVFGWEFYATATGTLTLMILTYKPGLNSTTICEDSQVFYSTSGRCNSADDPIARKPIRTTEDLNYLKSDDTAFIVTYKAKINVESLGYNFVSAESIENPEYSYNNDPKAKSFLGYKVDVDGGARIGYRPTAHSEGNGFLYNSDADEFDENNIDPSKFLPVDSEKSLLRAIVVYPTEIIFRHQFSMPTPVETPNELKLSLTSKNGPIHRVHPVQIVVSGVQCSNPEIEFDPETIGTLSQPKEFEKKSPIVIHPSIKMDCIATKNNTKQWKIRNINNSTVDTTNIRLNNAMLVIPKLHLVYGVYELKFCVKMELGMDVHIPYKYCLATYIKIVPSAMYGGIVQDISSFITVGIEDILELRPKDHFVDPDEIGGEQGFDRFEYLCYDMREESSVDRSNNSLRSMPLTKEELSDDTVISKGGCFRQGPGYIGNQTHLFDEGSINIEVRNMQVNQTYRLRVDGIKNTLVLGSTIERRATAELTFEVVDNTPPKVAIHCIAGNCEPSNGEQRILPNYRLAFQGECYCRGFPCSFKWAARDELGDIKEFENYVDGIESTTIAISTDIFSNNIDVETIEICLTCKNLNDSSAGKSIVKLAINNPPKSGSCQVSCADSISFDESVLFSCSGWRDSDGISRYELILSNEERNITKLTYSGVSSSFTTKLSPGSWDIKARIYDTLGAFVDKVIKKNVTVSRPNFKENSTELFRRLSKDIDESLSNGEESNVLALAARIGEVVQLSGEQEAETTNIIGLVSPLPGFHQEHKITNLSKVLTEEQRETLRKLEEDRKQHSQIIERVIGGVAELNYQKSLEMVQTQGKVLSEMVNDPSVLSFLSMDLLQEKCDQINDVVTTLKNDSIQIPKEKVIDMLKIQTKLMAVKATANNIIAVSPSLKDQQDVKEDDEAMHINMDPLSKDIDPQNADDQYIMALKRKVAAQRKKVAVKTMEYSVNAANRLVNSLVAEEKAVEVETNYMRQKVMKTSINRFINGEAFSFPNGSGIVFPFLEDICASPSAPLNCTNNTIIGVVFQEYSSNPVKDEDDETSRESAVPGLTIFNENGTEIIISNLSKRIEVEIKNKLQKEEIDKKEHVGVLNLTRKFPVSYRKIELARTELISATLEIKIGLENNTEQNVTAYLRFGDFPKIDNDSYAEHDNDSFVENKPAGSNNSLLFFFDNDEIDTYMDLYNTTVVRVLIVNATREYSFKSARRSCSSFDSKLNAFTSNGIQVLRPPTLSGIDDTDVICRSSHLTSFCGGWIVVPNTIDWDFVFSGFTLDKNVTLLVFVGVISTLYSILLIWARRADKKDIEQLGLTPLADNNPSHNYYYEMYVFTGLRKNAGTKSRVQFFLSGENDETEVRTLSDDKRPILRRGGTDGFLLSTERSLGDLLFCRIWHDNSGEGMYASWYLKYILINDVQTQKKYYFISNSWFAVEEGDGKLDRLLPIAGREQKVDPSHIVPHNVQKNMADDHLWFSVIARPPKSRFTRVQRVSSCFSLMLCTMVTNAMFYEKDDPSSSNSTIIGPFSISPEQISIGVISNLIVFPVSMLIVQLFRRSRLRTKRVSPVHAAIQKMQQSDTSVKNDSDSNGKDTILSEDTKREDTEQTIGEHCQNMSGVKIVIDNTEDLGSPEATCESDRKSGNKRWMFPWWCRYVAWALVVLTTLVSGSFIIFYGVQFKDEKCRKWITSMLVSMVMSIFVTQPIKVLLVAIILSMICRSTDDEDAGDEEDEEQPNLQQDEELLHSYTTDGYIASKTKCLYTPLDQKYLEDAKEKRLKQLKMYTILYEVTLYSIFTFILIIISYQLRDPSAAHAIQNMENQFIKVKPMNMFAKLRSNHSNIFFNYTNSVAIKNLRAGYWYNGGPPFGQRGFTGDRVSRLMGYATLRQIRVKPKDGSECNDVCADEDLTYSFGNHDESNYGIGWTLYNASIPTSPEYIYRSADELNSWPVFGKSNVYKGGGYVVHLNGSIYDLQRLVAKLKREEWIGAHTKAIFIEFTVYNPNVNLFIASTILFEWVSSGSIWTWHRFEPLNLIPYLKSNAMWFDVTCQIAFALFVLYFIYHETKKVAKAKMEYFKQFWNWIELFIIAMSIGAIAMYFWRLKLTNDLTDSFKKHHGNSYNNFQFVAYYNENLTYYVGLLCFIVTIKFLRLLRFNKRMSLLASTLKYGAKPLAAFGVVFGIVFFAFVQVFYLLLMTTLEKFNSMVNSMLTVVQMMLGRFSFNDMKHADPILAPIFFFLFTFILYLVLINMFVTILNETFAVVQNDVAKQSNEHEMVDFTVQRFKAWIGFIPTKQNEDVQSVPPEVRVSNVSDGVAPVYPSAIEKFPEKIEQMLLHACRLYKDDETLCDELLNSRDRGHKTKATMKLFLATDQDVLNGKYQSLQ
ncbi:unnamed protein product [Owenia fusiformis]|uniref:Uncharacterized protein n=1 Tax=Owenia fusiformis TaxID=6347 RepID=A0A8J1XU25_OWEFU|nr:unnamed protein product [Owenia fusiformis]